MLGVVLGTALLFIPFIYFERFDLALPTAFSIAMLAIATGLRWRLKQHAWFWITLAAIGTIHVVVILSVPWTTKRTPAVVLTGAGFLDLYAIFVILAVVENAIGKREIPKV